MFLLGVSKAVEHINKTIAPALVSKVGLPIPHVYLSRAGLGPGAFPSQKSWLQGPQAAWLGFLSCMNFIHRCFDTNLPVACVSCDSQRPAALTASAGICSVLAAHSGTCLNLEYVTVVGDLA